MKQFRDIGISPLKFENHITSSELDACIYSINDELYFLTNKYINLNTKIWLKNLLVKIADKAKSLTLTDKQEPRRKELLDKMRKVYKLIESYKPSQVPLNEEKEFYEKTAKYQVSVFLRLKQAAQLENREIDDIDLIRLLRENKRIEQLYIIPFKEARNGAVLSLKSFYSMQYELLTKLENLYKFQQD